MLFAVQGFLLTIKYYFLSRSCRQQESHSPFQNTSGWPCGALCPGITPPCFMIAGAALTCGRWPTIRPYALQPMSVLTGTAGPLAPGRPYPAILPRAVNITNRRKKNLPAVYAPPYRRLIPTPFSPCSPHGRLYGRKRLHKFTP